MAEELSISSLFQPSKQARAALGAVRTIGIDLGTTTSVVAEARWDPSSPDRAIVRCLEVAQPTERDGVFVDVLVPSAVAVVGEEKLVGEGARRVAARGLHQDRRFFLETKNFMGTRRVYGGAPEGFRTPVEIAGHILEYLAEAIRTADPSQVDRQVVTVPGSFNPAQRRDTRRAAELAGLSLGPGDLLDEPLAAFLDFASRHELPPLAQRQRLAVFDWAAGPVMSPSLKSRATGAADRSASRHLPCPAIIASAVGMSTQPSYMRSCCHSSSHRTVSGNSSLHTWTRSVLPNRLFGRSQRP
jgi:hypothetical protein